MQTSDFDYYLPEELIAQHPLDNRGDSRLLVLSDGQTEHKRFEDLIGYLNEGDCLFLNNTRVMPARLYGTKKDSGGKIEFLLLKRLGLDTWEVALKPGKRAREGAEFVFGDKLYAKVLKIVEGGNRIVQFSWEGVFESVLEELGEIPLPHYIKEKLENPSRYQTVYSKEYGSAAAPTAGLHFSEEFLERIRKKGVETAFLTLHVGLGTFRPVKTENIEEHKMHSESYEIPVEAAEKINATRRRGSRIVAVGTTSVRTLESAADERGFVMPSFGETDIFIYPGYKFRAVDALVTNFHLPKSTLLMLVSAFAGKEEILAAYREAVEKRYRFFSFGDAMYMTRKGETPDV